MDLHCFDKQENLAIDLYGNLESISMMRSMGIEYEFSLLLMLSSKGLNLWYRNESPRNRFPDEKVKSENYYY